MWTSRQALRLPEAAGDHAGLAPGEGAGAKLSVAGHASLRLLALGDSIVAGVGVDRTDEALPAQLAHALAALRGDSVHWRARGVNGQRSAGLLRMLHELEPAQSAPQLVLVSNGINDLTRPQSAATVLSQMQKVLEALERRFPDSLVVCPGLPPIGVFPGLPEPLRGMLDARAVAVDAALGAWAATRRAVLHLPFNQPVRAEEFAADGYHPNAAGVHRWATVLAPAIQGGLARKSLDNDFQRFAP